VTGARTRLVLALTAVWVLSPVALAAARYPSWWAWIAPESTPMTWLQSVVLVVAAVGSLLVGHVLLLQSRTRPTAVGSAAAEPAADDTAPVGARTWLLLAAGFAALGIDERFALHERVRDGILAPRGVTVPFLPWVAPGDFLILAVAVIGLAVLPMVWRAVRPDPAAGRALLLGVTLAVLAVASDSVDPATWSVQGERIQQSLEEVVELASGLALSAAVWLRLLGLLEPSPEPAPRTPSSSPG
jgi:hypothetical protein